MAQEEIQQTSQTTPTVQQEEPSPWWLVALGGLALAGLGLFVVYETLAIFSTGAATWLECVRGDGLAMTNCDSRIERAYDYRYGLDAIRALWAGLFSLLVGPIPMIVMLNRYRNNAAGLLVFLLVMLPYGLLAFLVLVIGTLVVIFYGVELV